jgi:hypothetical protein
MQILFYICEFISMYVVAFFIICYKFETSKKITHADAVGVLILSGLVSVCIVALTKCIELFIQFAK